MQGLDAFFVAVWHTITALPNVHGWKLAGDFVIVDLIAATTNALNGALLARRPDHYKNFTVIGILLMALVGGIGGGATRDIIANRTPSSFMNPAYIFLCLIAGVIGYFIAYKSGELFREGLFQFLTSFSLPWYAISGAMVGVAVGMPVVGILALADRADRREALHRPHLRGAAQAVCAGRVVRRNSGPCGSAVAARNYGRARQLVGDRNRFPC